MVGDRLLVAPILQKRAVSRSVYLPQGVWQRENGEIIRSGGPWIQLTYGDDAGVFQRLADGN